MRHVLASTILVLLSLHGKDIAESQIPRLSFGLSRIAISRAREAKDKEEDILALDGVVSNASNSCILFRGYNYDTLPRHVWLSVQGKEVFRPDVIVVRISVAEVFRVGPGESHPIRAEISGKCLCPLRKGTIVDWEVCYQDLSAGAGMSWSTNFIVSGSGRYIVK